MKLLRQAGCLAAGVLLTLAVMPAQANSPVYDELRFEVLLDDQPIGFHRFRIDRSGDVQRVESEAQFDVRVLFVPVYSYRHQNTEVWRDGCLAAIRSQTDANGEQYRVQGEREETTFTLRTHEATRQYGNDCLMTFAYWNRDFVKQRRLINTQTGDLVAVEVQPVAAGTVMVGDVAVPADGYRLRNPAEQVDILVWYAQSDSRWLSLETVLANGRVMRYLPAGDRLASAADTPSATAGTP